MIKSLSHEYIVSRLSYSEETGLFHWKAKTGDTPLIRAWNSDFAGRVAGTLRPDLYVKIGIGYYQIQAQRLAWFYVHKHWPNCVDHINGNTMDNRIANLRNVDNKENQRNAKIAVNNKSGVRGVCWKTRDRRWVASISDGKTKIELGSYLDFDEAVAVRKRAEAEYGYHPNHGRSA